MNSDNKEVFPLVWAHRGASGYAPENTLEAFELAVKQHADGIELDVQLTRDGIPVIIHDETIDRTSNGSGWVKDFTLAELRAFNYNRTKPEFARADIPTMQEVFDLIRPSGLTINIELKTGIVFYEGLEEQILDLTAKNNMEDRVIYSSFNHYSVRRIHELNPSAATGLLYADGPIDVASYAHRLGVNALHPALYNLQYPGFMEDANRLGLEVNVWTVNDPAHIQYCIDKGVHAIITNYPDLVSRGQVP